MPSGREFPPEVRAKALEMVRGGITMAVVARRLGVSRSVLYKWHVRRAEVEWNDDLQREVAEYLHLTVEGAKHGVAVLTKIALDPKEPTSIRTRAAQILVESANSIAVTAERGEASEAQTYIEEAAAG